MTPTESIPVPRQSTQEPAGPEPRPLVAMLLDNHYGPDRRIAFEARLLRDAGMAVRIIAWDRRDASGDDPPPPPSAELRRVPLPAPARGGLASIVAVLRWSARVYRRRAELFEGARLLVVNDVYLLPLGFLLARRLKLPFAYDAHEDFSVLEEGRYPALLRRIVAGLEGFLARRARAVIVPGASRLARWSGVTEDVTVLPNVGAGDWPPDDSAPAPAYDLVHCGGIEPARGVDLLLDLAERRPDLRFAIAGTGREAAAIEQRAARLPNVDFQGWVSNPDRLLASSVAIYYHYDPAQAYSRLACPNTLYQALRVRRPLIYACGGEPELLNRQFKIGVRANPTTSGLESALQKVAATESWQFEEAWASIARAEALQSYPDAIMRAVGARRR